MGKSPVGKPSPPSPQPPEEQLVESGLEFLQVRNEQEEAVSDAVEATVAGVLEFIRDRQLEDIIYDHTADVVTTDITRIYATIDIRYDPGHDESLPPQASGQLAQDLDPNTTVTNGGSQLTIQQQRHQQVQLCQKTGTLLPSPEPEPAPIDRWARGWVVARSTDAGDWNQKRQGGLNDDWSDESGSLRHARSVGTGLNSAHDHGSHTGRRSQHRHHHNNSNKNDQTEVPFPLAPEVREDQSLPPWIPVKGRHARKGGRGGGTGGRRGRRRHGNRTGGDGASGGGGADGSGDGPESGNPAGSAEDNDGEDDDVDSRVKELGGREWTIDGSGELLIVDRPQGDAMPKTVVSALFNFRDIQDQDNRVEDPGAAPEGSGGRGGGGGGSVGSGKRRSNSGGGGGGGTELSKQNAQSSSAPRRTSRRRSSRRPAPRRSVNRLFFELEPTVQPNLTHSLDRPGPGVSVSDGDSLKEGPSWPQDPNHMSRSEYRERQRQQDLSDTHTLDGGEDASTLGFSLGSVQSAPALGGLGAGLNGNSGGGGGGGLGGAGGRKAFSGGGDGGGRGTSITAFENVNPFAGGVRVATSTPKRVTGEGRTVAATATGGDLSPLSASVGGQSGGMFGFGAGPESSSVGEESDDLHLALVKDPEWGRNVRGSIKEAGYLPKVKQVSRERPLTHERPRTRNPRDPRNVPPRQNFHSSPKSYNDGGDDGYRKKAGGAEGSVKASSASFPSLPMSLMGWGRDGLGGGNGGASPAMAGGSKGHGMITMTKPKEILVEGLLR